MPAAHPKAWFPRRGEVYFAHLDKQRPVLILSVDALNRYALDVCVVPITSVERKNFSLRIPIRTGEAGLKLPSWAKCDQVTTLAKSYLRYPPLGTISRKTLAEIEQSTRIALGLI